MPSLAILYVNSGHENGKYVKEAAMSARSFKAYLPDAKFYLYTDYINDDYEKYIFDEIVLDKFYVPEAFENRVHLNGQMIVKHKAMLELSEKHILYLGADTYALKPDVQELEKLLSKFDISVTHAPVRINTDIGNTPIPEVPSSFPEMNCDLILYNNNQKVREFLKQWQQSYLEDLFSHTHDQGTFRYLLYNSDLRLCILPPEYNYRELEYREDTIILQNRFSLYKYLNNENYFKKLLRKILKKLV